MRAYPGALALFFAASSILVFPSLAQDDDKEISEAFKKANEAAKKMGIKAPMEDAKKMMDDMNKKEAEHKKKQIAAAKSDLKFPTWTPPVPQFKPDGPIAVQKVDDEDLIAQTGTSPLPPVEIAEAWYNAAKEGFSRSRSTNNINGRITVYTTLRKNNADPPEAVKMTADRKPEEKITKITISKPLPEIPDDDD
jgi:hypothetical protein